MLKNFLKIKYVNSHWEVSSKLFQKNGSTATGTATVKQLMNGKVVKTTKKISIHCSPTGNLIMELDYMKYGYCKNEMIKGNYTRGFGYYYLYPTILRV